MMELNPVIDNSWNGLLFPNDIQCVQDDGHRGIYSFGPLEKGYATFLGNSLRRVLLSSLYGAAVTMIRITDVEHEFRSVPGILEDVATIVLKLKQVRFRFIGDGTVKLNLTAHAPEGGKYITAADIDTASFNEAHDAEVIKVLNPDFHIATLSQGATFNMELWITTGRGYTQADEQKNHYPEKKSTTPNFEDVSVSLIPPANGPGIIPVDSIFRPIYRVNYRVNYARVDDRCDYEELLIEVDGDGSVTPREALAYGAKILKDQMGIFEHFQEENEELVEEQQDESEPVHNENLNRQVDELELSVRSSNCLKSANITYIGELVQRSEQDMLRTKNFGRKSLRELKEILGSMNLQLGMKLEGWSPSARAK